MESMEDRGMTAISAYLERIGIMPVDQKVETPYGLIDMVAIDGIELVLIDVGIGENSSIIKESFDSTRAEEETRAQKAKYYMEEISHVSMPVRYDHVSLLVIADERALLRHRRDAYQNQEEG
jgi:putative endonuclease